MAFRRRNKVSPSIPTSSMADIAFLLLIFFMATTIFKHEDGLEVNLPRAAASKKQKSEQLANIWVDHKGRISINDKMVAITDIGSIMTRRLEENPTMIVAFKADNRAKYEILDTIMEELKRINAIRINFSSDVESSGKK